MLHYTQSTVFNTPAQAIVNTVNCLGVMGAGLALEFKLRFPEMYENYRKKCQNKEIKIGEISIYKTQENVLIINFPTKQKWRDYSRIEWIDNGLNYFVKNYQLWGINSVAFPKLGCERGGLQWEKVKTLMEHYFTPLNDIDIYICLDTKAEPEGIEKDMIQLLNCPNLWVEALNVKPQITRKIIDYLPKIKRFRQLQNISGLGKKTYQELFQFLYSMAHKQPLTLEPKVANQTTQNSLQFSFLAQSKSQQKLDYTTHDQFQTKSESPKYQLSVNKEVIRETRIKLAVILSNLGIKAEEIRFLTWNNLIKINNKKIIKISEEKSIGIPDQVFEKMQELKILQQITNEEQLIISSLKKGKSGSQNSPLAVRTIKDLIRKGKKLQSESQQLQLSLGE